MHTGADLVFELEDPLVVGRGSEGRLEAKRPEAHEFLRFYRIEIKSSKSDYN